MIINPYRFGGAPPPNPYLDGLASSPFWARSLKKLISTATNSIRVRRSGDDAQQDIGFDGDALDTTALALFVGSDSAYVVTVYDQTGGGRDMTQATSSKQPRIVNAGSYEGIMKWDGTDDAMSSAAVALNQPQLAIFIDGMIPASVGSSLIVMESSSNWNTNSYSFLLYTNTGQWEAGMNSASPGTPNQRVVRYTGIDLSSRAILSVLFDRSLTGTSQIRAWANGVQGTGTSAAGYNTNQTGSFTTRDHYLGGRSAASLYSSPQIFSDVGYNTDVSSIRSAIETILG